MNILDQIIADKKKEVSLRKGLFPASYWEHSSLFERPTISLADRLKSSSTGIIAEHKRRSPSKANINSSLSITEVATGYENAGACGMSVLTDLKYFGGALEDLVQARSVCNLPLLRKEFIVDEYQLIEAKAHGADVVLLIAAVLTRAEIKSLSRCAKQLQLEVLLEVHTLEEMEKALMPSIDIVGVNNRDLKTFNVSIETSIQIAPAIPSEFTKVSESGISKTASVKLLKEHGFQGFLVGEQFMKTNSPGEAAKQFIDQMQ